MSAHKIYLYPIGVRIWHAVNALSIILLIATGISLQYASSKYNMIPFKTAVYVHNFVAAITIVNYLFFLVFNFVTKNGKYYRLKRKGLIKKMLAQMNYYLTGYFKGQEKPFVVSKKDKFNPLQKVTYVVTMYIFVPLVIISGIGLLFPEVVIEKFAKASGIELTAIFHASVGYLISLFLIIHIYIASFGKHPLRNYRSIVTGYHEE
jgi:thiosulfate reductase cytochrome b subunit